jgi:HEAT repeat protein
MALGRIGDPRSFHPLQTALQHPSPDVRHAVCGALADLRIADADAALRKLAQEDSSRTTWGASVAEAALRAADAIAAARPAEEHSFDQLRAVLRRHQEG